MVASQASGALSFPFGEARAVQGNVVQRAYVDACLAVRAGPIGTCAFIAQQEAVEQRAEHVALYPREAARMDIIEPAFPLIDGFGNVMQSRVGAL